MHLSIFSTLFLRKLVEQMTPKITQVDGSRPSRTSLSDSDSKQFMLKLEYNKIIK